MRTLQLIDSLNAGGAERVALNYANLLTGKVEQSFLCATRSEGLLKEDLRKDVGYLYLNRKKIFDLQAVFKFLDYIKRNRINIIHAHSSSYFFASIIKLLYPKIKIVWHDHFGNRPNSRLLLRLILKLCSIFFSKVIVVNNNLKKWAEHNLFCKDIIYVRNFPFFSQTEKMTQLKGVNGKRIICLANLRPEKDHITLINSFSEVVKLYPEWTLHCVGNDVEDDYSMSVKKMITELNLTKNVFFYGSRQDISNILNQCEIGVLSSKSEGLPVALLEYGLSNLTIVATKVGECVDVLKSDDFGILVEPENREALKNALIYLLENEEKRELIAKNFYQEVITDYSVEAVMNNIVDIYKNSVN